MCESILRHDLSYIYIWKKKKKKKPRSFKAFEFSVPRFHDSQGQKDIY